MNDSIKPLENRFEGWYYDGESPVRHAVAITLSADGLHVAPLDGELSIWTYDTLRIVSNGDYGEPVRLERTAGVGVESAAISGTGFLDSLNQYAPDAVTAGRPFLDLRSWQSVLVAGLGVALVASVLYFSGARWMADTAARFMPRFAEERMGKAVVNILAPAELRCEDPKRLVEITKLVDRLAAAAGSEYQFRVIYVDRPIVNAFAAPAGYIVVYSGLLLETASPEEFAGVLAHEMEHVIHKHSTRAIGRKFSGSTILSLMVVDSGGTPAALQAAVGLLDLQYQRDDEEEADLQSVPLLAKAGIAADGLVRFMRRLYANPNRSEISKYLSSHPALLDRANAMQWESRKVSAPATSIMTFEQWAQACAACAPK